MSLKSDARTRSQSLVDDAAHRPLPEPPADGWLRTVRKALGMSGRQLADRMGVTRARIAQAEQAELSGAATLRSMRAAAEAMGCRFVYVLVPDQSIDDIVLDQARKKAAVLVRTASVHMALEDQALPDDTIAQEVTRLTRDFVREMPSDLWTDG